MARPPFHAVIRRGFLRALLALPAACLLTACGSRPTDAAPPSTSGAAETVQVAPRATQPAATGIPARDPTPTAGAAENVTQILPPTPSCGDEMDVTPAQTEGPYYTPNTPERASLLEPGMEGTRLIVTGYVLTTDCRPVAGALLDFWQADDRGVYDNAGYRLRGHQFTDEEGRYFLETILPGAYAGRTRHIHVKVQPPNQPALTTQLYFPGEPQNEADRVFRPALVVEMQDAGEGKLATFNFVLEVRP